MTDLEKTKELYTSFGVGFKESRGYRNLQSSGHQRADQYMIELSFKAGEGGVGGYTDFCVDMHFSLEGKFIQVGVWE